MYLAGRLEENLRKRRVVVFYDPRREFIPFFDETEVVGEGVGGLPRVVLNDLLAHVARFDGSFFRLRHQIEPILAQPTPEPLLVYVPGVGRDRQHSLLMEAELGGGLYQPQLKRLAPEVLRKQLTEGQVDELLHGEVTYQDVAAFLRSEGAEQPSVLRAILGSGSGEVLLVRWLLDPGFDNEIVAKGGTGELSSLLAARLGLTLSGDPELASARRSTFRYVLVNEFRLDLGDEPPSGLASVPAVPTSECGDRTRAVAQELRVRDPEVYATIAQQVQTDLQLTNLDFEAGHLGRVDTFPFEEKRLLAYVAELLDSGKHVPAEKLIEERRESFWATRDLRRQAQWEACRRIAALSAALYDTRRALERPPRGVQGWVQAYAAPDGLHRVDRLHRDLEAWCATLDDEPVAEAALVKIRVAYEDVLRRMAEGFTGALQAGGWSVGGCPRQADIFTLVQQGTKGPVAYFLVDALRFEMGLELAALLTEAENLSVEAAAAALPTITPVGMAALMPGAAADFSVVDADGQLAARIENATLRNWTDRWKQWKARVPGIKEVALGKVLDSTTNQLTRAIEGAPLVLIRSQEIDLAGETDGGMLAHHVMASMVGNLARAIRKLARAGITRFVVVADHGHLFALSKDEDMKTDAPGGDTVLLHRRCWVGRGGKNPAGTVRVTAADLGYDSDLDFVFPQGMGVFKAGGGPRYHHGGLSLQEMVVPVLRVRMPSVAEAAPAPVVELHAVPTQIPTRAVGVTVTLGLGLFTEPTWLRVVLMAEGEEVGRAGMATGGALDRSRGMVQVTPGSTVNVGLMLTRDDCAAVRIVVLHPESDAILAQTNDIPVKLSI
jgi:hypothetical protein